MKEGLSFLQAKVKIESWCAYQERCQFEVEQKLQSFGLTFEQRSQLIAHLIAQRFIDEERFAEAFVSGKFRIKKWGKVKIKQNLKNKQISSYSIEKALKTIDLDDYLNVLTKILNVKWNDLVKEKDPYKRQMKTFLHAQQKGYESSWIQEAWSTLKSE
jgi:regulatory protein